MSYIKYNANQAGPFTADNNLMDFDFQGMVTDFSKSYVNLHFKTTYTGLPNGSVVGANLNGGANYKILNSDLIENSSLDSDVVGNIENTRRTNILTHNLKFLTTSEAELVSDDNYQCSTNKRGHGDDYYYNQPCDVQINSVGNTPSKYLNDPVMKIKLKDFLLGNGNNSRYPGDKLGNQRLHLELNPDVIQGNKIYNPMDRIQPNDSSYSVAPHCKVAAANAAATAVVTNDGNFADVATFIANTGLGIGAKIAIDTVNYHIEDLTPAAGNNITIGIDPAVPAGGIPVDTPIIYPDNTGRSHVLVRAALTAQNEIALAGTYTVDNIPVYVGMPIRIPGQASAAEELQVISNVELTATGIVIITVPTVLDGALDANNAIAFYNDTITNVNFQFTRAELVLKVFGDMTTTDKELVYYTYSTEEAPGTTLQTYQKLYYLEPECVNCYIMYPPNNDLNSNNTNLVNYRLRINNLDTTNRNVKIHDPLYNDCISKTLLNSGYEFKNSRYFNNDVTDGNEEVLGMIISFIGTPTPVGNEKSLQLNLNGTAALNMDRLVLFKQLIKTINL